jgi:hypothetical protein
VQHNDTRNVITDVTKLPATVVWIVISTKQLLELAIIFEGESYFFGLSVWYTEHRTHVDPRYVFLICQACILLFIFPVDIIRT